jgi:hypothetical protein
LTEDNRLIHLGINRPRADDPAVRSILRARKVTYRHVPVPAPQGPRPQVLPLGSRALLLGESSQEQRILRPRLEVLEHVGQRRPHDAASVGRYSVLGP